MRAFITAGALVVLALLFLAMAPDGQTITQIESPALFAGQPHRDSPISGKNGRLPATATAPSLPTSSNASDDEPHRAAETATSSAETSSRPPTRDDGPSASKSGRDGTEEIGEGSQLDASTDGERQEQLFHRPVAIDAAHIEVGKTTISLPDIDAFPLDHQCDANGRTWPCGMRARTALRNLLRARSIRCRVPSDLQPDQAIAATCTVRGDDIGAWMVRNGWVKAAPGGPYGPQEAAARDAHLGIWRQDAPSYDLTTDERFEANEAASITIPTEGIGAGQATISLQP